jgi:hypothetical protein
VKLVDDVHRLERALNAIEELAAAGQAFLERQTRVEQYLRAFSVNDVLWSGSISLAATGQWTKSFTVDIAALTVVNLTAVDVDFTTGRNDFTWHPGPGQFQAPPLSILTMPVTGRSISVWTDAGALPVAPVLVVASAMPLPPYGSVL